MAQYMGTVQGNRNGTSRLGSKASGLRSTARGWNLGGSVYMAHTSRGDAVSFYLDGGSNGVRTPLHLLTTHEDATWAEIAEQLQQAADIALSRAKDGRA